MPTKTKKEVKQSSAKKKTATTKTATKTVRKKAVKKTTKKVVMTHLHEEDETSQLAPMEKIIHRFEKRFVFVPLCSNCDHVPMRVNRLVALMTVLVVVLSGIIITQAQSIDLTSILVALAQV